MNIKCDEIVTVADVLSAQRRIAPFVRRTPVMQARTLDKIAGARLYFKCECLQSGGAFKARGAHNAVFALNAGQAARGVVTHSSGNHAAALALAARNRGIPSFVVMPANASEAKVEAVRRLGGRITICKPTLTGREKTCEQLQRETGAAFIHPYDDERVIAGQATAALEFLDECPDLDAIIVPVGGGGLLSGTAIIGKRPRWNFAVYGAEPSAADDACRSFKAGRLMPIASTQTIADGLRTALGAKTFAIIRTEVDDIVTVTEAAIVSSMRLTMEVMKLVIEPSAAVPLAAILARKIPMRGRRVGVILSGGNVDFARLPWMKRENSSRR